MKFAGRDLVESGINVSRRIIWPPDCFLVFEKVEGKNEKVSF